jgi:acyl-CoA dehydrogenase
VSWDFSTDSAFQEELDWMADFVRTEIWPIETIADELGDAGVDRALGRLKDVVKARRLWAAQLSPEPAARVSGKSSSA